MKPRHLPLLLFFPPALTMGMLIAQLFHVAQFNLSLLTLLFSLQAAFATPLLLMTQEKDSFASKKDIDALLQYLDVSQAVDTQKLDKITEWIGVLLKSEVLRREQESAQPPRRTLR